MTIAILNGMPAWAMIAVTIAITLGLALGHIATKRQDRQSDWAFFNQGADC